MNTADAISLLIRMAAIAAIFGAVHSCVEMDKMRAASALSPAKLEQLQ